MKKWVEDWVFCWKEIWLALASLSSIFIFHFYNFFYLQSLIWWIFWNHVKVGRFFFVKSVNLGWRQKNRTKVMTENRTLDCCKMGELPFPVGGGRTCFPGSRDNIFREYCFFRECCFRESQEKQRKFWDFRFRKSQGGVEAEVLPSSGINRYLMHPIDQGESSRNLKSVMEKGSRIQRVRYIGRVSCMGNASCYWKGELHQRRYGRRLFFVVVIVGSNGPKPSHFSSSDHRPCLPMAV